MPLERWAEVKDLLADALTADAEGRRSMLERVARDDPRVHSELVEWLAYEDSARGLMEEPAAPRAAAPPRVNDRIGRFRIVEVIGLGGSGIVYAAEEEQLGRTVALKVLQRGADSQSAVDRFLNEAQLLARLQHPGIAQIFEAGTHGEGDAAQPFLAMEHVAGARTLVQYARERGLDLSARLALFAEACAAVGCAHRHGIVHRDLKPANVLIDDEGRVKLIDFGIAKLVGRDSALTNHGDLLGTLASMSPEQCQGGERGIDARTDVYALGVMLYELVCGQPPYDLDDLSISGAIETICLRAPERPSRIVAELDVDLEAIVLRCLEKDAAQRYASADELAHDLERFSANRPVQARTPAPWHRTRLFLRRHRVVASASAAVLLVLVASGVAFIVQSIRSAEVEARERARAERVTDFLRSVLFQASPYRADRAQTTALDLLDDAGRRLDAEFADDLASLADLHATLGRTYLEAGDYGAAELHGRRAVEVYDELAAGEPSWMGCAARNALGDVLNRASQHAAAALVLREALAFQDELAEDQPIFRAMSESKLATSLTALGELVEAEALAARALQTYAETFPAEHEALGAGHLILGGVYEAAGELEAAERELGLSLANAIANHGTDAALTARRRCRVAEVVALRGRRDEALDLARTSLAQVRTLLPAGHPDREAAEALVSRLAAR